MWSPREMELKERVLQTLTGEGDVCCERCHETDLFYLGVEDTERTARFSDYGFIWNWKHHVGATEPSSSFTIYCLDCYRELPLEQ